MIPISDRNRWPCRWPVEVERIWSDRIQKTQDLQCFQRSLCQAILVPIAAQLFCGGNREV
jgi:hypothetical protein